MPIGLDTLIDSFDVSFNKRPILKMPKDTIACLGETVKLNPVTNGSIFIWNTGNETSEITVTQPGKYWIMTSIGTCTASDTENVQFKTPPHINLGRDTVLCGAKNYLLDAGLSGLTYKWSTGDTTQKITVGKSGVYWANAFNGACSITDTILITFKAVPVITILKDTLICKGERAILKADTGAKNYLWSTGDTTTSITVQNPGLYWVIATTPPCSTKADATVNYAVLPSGPVFKNEYLCSKDNETLEVSAGNSPGHTWLPSGDTATMLTISDTGTYVLQITGSSGCINTDTIHVYQDCPPLLFMPTAFTPNGDLLNDVYLPVGSDIKNYSMNIFDRWGELIFSTSELKSGWDGTFNGLKSPDGCYLYLVHYEGQGQNAIIKKDISGTFMLLR